MRPIINAVVDKGSFFEVAANFGRPVITGLARLEGRAVLILASDPFHYGGSWTADACQKIVRWVDFAETFHLPVVYLMDCPGFMIGLEAEKAATIRHGVRAMAAVNQTTVPWCTVIVRNSFGVAGVVHQPAGRFSMRYAWPSAYWGSLPLEGGIEAAYRADIDAAEDPQAKLEGNRGSPQPAAFAVPHRGEVLGRGDHRPAQDPLAVVRVRAARRAPAYAGPGDEHGDQAVAHDPEKCEAVFRQDHAQNDKRRYAPNVTRLTLERGQALARREIKSTISAATTQSAPAKKKAGR